MTCRELTDFLADYVAGALDARVRSALEAHLADCADCIAYVRGYRDTIRLTKDSMPAGDGVEAMPRELVDGILDASGRPRR